MKTEQKEELLLEATKSQEELDAYLLQLDTAYNELKLLYDAFDRQDWAYIIGRDKNRLTTSDIHAIKRKLNRITKDNILFNERDIRNGRDNQEKWRIWTRAFGHHSFEFFFLGLISAMSFGRFADNILDQIFDGSEIYSATLTLLDKTGEWSFGGVSSAGVRKWLEDKLTSNAMTVAAGVTAGATGYLAAEQYRYLRTLGSAVRLLQMVEAYENMTSNRIIYKRSIAERIWDFITMKSPKEIQAIMEIKAKKAALETEKKFRAKLKYMPEYINYHEEGKIKRIHATELFNW